LTVAKIVDVKSFQSTGFVSTLRSSNELTNDANRKDIIITVEINCKVRNNECFFAQTQRIKIDEIVILPFKKITFSYPISKITPL
jgi:hypothetical protein